MIKLTVTEKGNSASNLLYIQSTLGEILTSSGTSVKLDTCGGRGILQLDCPEPYLDIIRAELLDKVAEIIAVKYKYDFFNSKVKVAGLNNVERELLLTGLIAADLVDDKKYIYQKLNSDGETAIDGAFNFLLQPLKSKWNDIVDYVPITFLASQLKDFIVFLLENKRKRVYIDGGKVYDSHYRRLKRCLLLNSQQANIIKEVLLSNCGEVELCGKIPETDEFFIKQFFGDRVFFANSFTN